MAKFWNQKVLLARAETVYGTDPAPTGAQNAILAQQVRLAPMEGQDVPRELELPEFGADATIPADLHQKLSFRVELAASGFAGTAPAWGPLIRACGCAQTIANGASVTYNPITDASESVTFHFFYDGIRHRLRGARGTFKLVLEASGIPYLDFEFLGLFEPATDVVNPSPALQGFREPLVATMANTPLFTIDGTALVLRNLTFDAAVKVEPRFLVGVGAESVMITGRSAKIDLRIEAVSVAVFNPAARAQSAQRLPIVLQHGTAAGGKITLNAPLAQMMRPGGIEQQQNVAEWPLSFTPRRNIGNDQWTLVLT